MTQELLSGKQIAALLIDKKTKVIKDPNLAQFTKDFYGYIASHNPTNLTNEREVLGRRLDAMARLLVGDETCAAVAFDGNELQVATNKNSHSKDRLKIQINGLVRADPYVVDNYQIHSVLYLSYNDSIPVRYVSTQHSTFYYSKKYKALKLDEESTNNIEIKLTPSMHMIPFVPDMDLNISGQLTDTLSLSISEYINMSSRLLKDNELELPTPAMVYIAYNSLHRRTEQLVKYMASMSVAAKVKGKIDISPEYFDDKRQQILVNSLCWEAAKWYHDLEPFPKNYKDSNKSQLDEFITTLNKNFAEYKQKNGDLTGTVTLVKNWLEDVIGRIEEGSINTPPFIKNNIKGNAKEGIESFLCKAERYFIDISKLDQFIMDETTKDSDFAKWLIKHANPLHSVANAIRVIDSLSDNVHAEIRILYDYLLRHKVPEYIATSILCCAHCKLIMDGYNIENISGIHARAYAEWVMPLEDFEKLEPTFLRRFLGEDLHKQYTSLTDLQKEHALQIIQSIAKISDSYLPILGIELSKIWNNGSTLATESDDENHTDCNIDITALGDTAVLREVT